MNLLSSLTPLASLAVWFSIVDYITWAVGLLFLVYIVWCGLRSPPGSPQAKTKAVADSESGNG